MSPIGRLADITPKCSLQCQLPTNLMAWPYLSDNKPTKIHGLIQSMLQPVFSLFMAF